MREYFPDGAQLSPSEAAQFEDIVLRLDDVFRNYEDDGGSPFIAPAPNQLVQLPEQSDAPTEPLPKVLEPPESEKRTKRLTRFASRLFDILDNATNPTPASENEPSLIKEGFTEGFAFVGRNIGVRIINLFATIPPISRTGITGYNSESYQPIEFSQRTEAAVGAATLVGGYVIASVTGHEPMQTAISIIQL